MLIASTASFVAVVLSGEVFCLFPGFAMMFLKPSITAGDTGDTVGKEDHGRREDGAAYSRSS